MKRAMRFLSCGFVILVILRLPVFAQQADLSRYTVFTGFAVPIEFSNRAECLFFLCSQEEPDHDACNS